MSYLSDRLITELKQSFIDYNKQKEEFPGAIVHNWIYKINNLWESGLINYTEFRSLMKINILTV